MMSGNDETLRTASGTINQSMLRRDSVPPRRGMEGKALLGRETKLEGRGRKRNVALAVRRENEFQVKGALGKNSGKRHKGS